MEPGLFQLEALERKKTGLMGSISPTQPASLRILSAAAMASAVLAASYLTFGTYAQRSRNALRPDKVVALNGCNRKVNLPLHSGAPAPSGGHLRKAEPLKSGMRFDTDVTGKQRRLIEWIFEPLYALNERLATT
ncbi:MAG TPA: hypothetical protein VF471_13810 [Pseudoxanthomonas sp.]